MDRYKSLLTEVNNVLKPFNYKKSGNTFFYNNENNIGIIDFQKGRSSNATSILFTINLGVYSRTLKIFDSFNIQSNPSISDCHWRKRIGLLLPQEQDFWWEINDKVSMPILTDEIINILKRFAIPEIQKYISDGSLEKSWMAGISDGLTKQQMYLYLIALLKIYNRNSLCSKVNELREFSKGKPFENNVMECLMKLGITDF